MKKLLCCMLVGIMLISSFSVFAMSTHDFDKGMSKGISYFNRGMYYEAKDEFQWFCDYNWGALNQGQQQYALDYLDGTKAKIWEWERYVAQQAQYEAQAQSSASSYSSNSSRDGYYYRTPYGKKYHLDPDCGGKNSYRTTNISGLSPCSKCAY